MSGFYILAPENSTYIVRFQALMVASMKVSAFWDTELRILIEVGQHFRRAYCLHHQGDDWGSMHLWNLGLLQGYDVAIYPRSCHLECTSYDVIFLAHVSYIYRLLNLNKLKRIHPVNVLCPCVLHGSFKSYKSRQELVRHRMCLQDQSKTHNSALQTYEFGRQMDCTPNVSVEWLVLWQKL
jgi:hypothetical protein